jgi:multiple antibiotic resistance protein
MNNFWLCFVPLFIAVDAFGTLPLFLGFVQGCDRKREIRILFLSVITAMIVALLFLFVGAAVLRMLGITVADFMVAGGIVLFMISIRDLLTTDKLLHPIDPESLGPVPLGVPLIVGPAVLTTIMLLVKEYGIWTTALAAVINIIIAGFVFSFAGIIIKFFGKSGMQIASKIASLLLAAIAVMMVRRVIMEFIATKLL